ncbi:hypothetical protein [Erwinia amylovora]
MCIRDRSGIEQKYAYKTNEKAGFPAFYGVPLMPVSYTHLDVYKRQA